MHILHIQAKMNRLTSEFKDLIDTIKRFEMENNEEDINNLYDFLDENYPFNDTLEGISKKVIAWNREFQENINDELKKGGF